MLMSFCVLVRDVRGLERAASSVYLEFRFAPYGGLQRPSGAHPEPSPAAVPPPRVVPRFRRVSSSGRPEGVPVPVGIRAAQVFENRDEQ